MTNNEETTNNFWEVWNNLPQYKPPAIFFRLYYDDQGNPLFYSYEDLPGNYIEVTPEQCRDADMRVRVCNGKLIEPKLNLVPKKLMPSQTGRPCHVNDVAVIVSESDPHTKWRLK